MSSASIEHLYIGNETIFDTPMVLSAEVVHGFNRGSKELGIPTANLNMDHLGPDGEEMKTGIYFGFALLNRIVYPTVVSVGLNPYYKNIKKTIEAHLIVSNPLDDFYGEHITLLLFGYLRDEANFKSLDELILAINTDIHKTKTILTTNEAISKYISYDQWNSYIPKTKL